MSKSSAKIESGRIGNIIRYARNGVQCERMRPESVFNPRTPKQILVRSKFGLTSKLGSNVLYDLIHPFWNPIAKKKQRTGYNLFVSVNNPAFRGGLLAAEILKLCLDKGINQEVFSVHKNEDRIQIHWDSSLTNHRKSGQDQLYLIELTTNLTVKIIDTKVFRENDYCEYEYSDTNDYCLFAFWRNGVKWSESRFIYSAK